MSSALRNHFQEGNSMDGALAEPSSLLHAELADGLHAMAQPLTILRGAMCALTLREEMEPANRRYLDMSAKQVDRLCDLMSGMQSLLYAAQNKVEFASFDLMEALDAILDRQQASVGESGVQIAVTKPDHSLYVFADQQGVEQALSAALKTALSGARKDDRIEIEIAPRDGFAEVMLRNDNFRERSLGSFERFNLTVVETMIRNQCGIYEYTDRPFSISLRLRVSEYLGAVVTSDCLQMAAESVIC